MTFHRCLLQRSVLNQAHPETSFAGLMIMVTKSFAHSDPLSAPKSQIGAATAAFLIGILAGCASQTQQAELTATDRPDADELLVVDCLLPSQIRKLGQSLTYLAPRRAVKTAARDCEIRGGEYVAYDRANYATALKVWLPQAKEGDSLAQTYVGEIYEKGLGIQPDYAVAAYWYRKAADQGYARAQIDLGYLYEKGLGVDKDVVAALNWYRMASGLEGGELEFTSSVEIASHRAQARELTALKQEVADREQQTEQLLRRLEKTEQQLAKRRDELTLAQQDVEALRTALAGERRSAGAPASGTAVPDTPNDSTTAQLEEQRRQLAERAAKVERQESELGERLEAAEQQQQRLLAQLERERQQAKALREQLAAQQEELSARRTQLAAAEKERDQARASLARLQATQDTADNRQSIEQLSQVLAEREAMVEKQRQEMAWLEREVEEQRAQLTTDLETAQQREQTLQRELDSRRHEIASLQAALTQAQAALSDAQAQLTAREAEVAQAQRALAMERERSAQQAQQASAEADKRLQEFESKLRQREAEIAKQKAEIGQLQASFDQQKAEYARLEKPAQVALAPIGPTIETIGPTIEIIEPPLAVTRGVPSVTLRAPIPEIEIIGRVSAPDELLTFRVNDLKSAVAKDGLFQVKMPVKRAETPVSVVAIDKSGHRAAVDFLLIPHAQKDQAAEREQASLAPSPPPTVDVEFGNYHALVIGNNQYQYLPDLSTAANDASAVAKVLREKYGFKTELLLNADRYSILSALNKLRENLTEDDNLLIYYAGHGELDATNQRGHWLPVDAEPESTANWISNVAITDILNVMSAKHILVVADSCYSGAMTRSSLARLPVGMTDQARVKWFQAMAKTRARAVLTSGGLEPVLDAGGGEHSVFAKAFLEVLNENDDILEGWRLFRAVRERVTQAALAFRVDQEPQYAPIQHAGHEAGEFLFLPSRFASLPSPSKGPAVGQATPEQEFLKVATLVRH